MGVRARLRGGCVRLYEAFPTPDEAAANDSQAVTSIIASCFDKSSESSLRNSLQRRLNRRRFKYVKESLL